ncbi:MAG TPA: hypothetical protein V6C91_08380 [Coleofasciculaceae cyanobacterium]
MPYLSYVSSLSQCIELRSELPTKRNFQFFSLVAGESGVSEERASE